MCLLQVCFCIVYSRRIHLCSIVHIVQVTGLLSQGRGEGNEWVTSFLVSYSLDAYHWLYITDQYGNQRVNTTTVVQL